MTANDPDGFELSILVPAGKYPDLLRRLQEGEEVTLELVFDDTTTEEEAPPA